ncbi:MAG: hypothetical protein AVDCRST_MAG17-159, partial [uncultured Solirubrobacterales bacterium]
EHQRIRRAGSSSTGDRAGAPGAAGRPRRRGRLPPRRSDRLRRHGLHGVGCRHPRGSPGLRPERLSQHRPSRDRGDPDRRRAGARARDHPGRSHRRWSGLPAGCRARVHRQPRRSPVDRRGLRLRQLPAPRLRAWRDRLRAPRRRRGETKDQGAGSV